jgi:hypothetical protein
MRAFSILAAGVALSAISLGLAGAASAEPSVSIKDAAVRVEVIPEARSDVKVEIQAGNPKLPLQVSQSGSRTVIDGGLAGDGVEGDRIEGCGPVGGEPVVQVRGFGDVAWADLPRVVIRTPMTVELATGGAVFGSVGRTDSLQLSNAGCGDWSVADVKGEFDLNQAGSGDTKAGAAGQAEVHIADSGHLAIQGVDGDLEVYVAGSGGVTAASVAGKFEAHVAGPGRVSVAGGRSKAVEVSILGSGEVAFNGVAGQVAASVSGSGKVTVAKAEGPVSKSVAGSGQVIVGP